MPDLIGRFTGGNPATSDRTPKGRTALREFLKVSCPKGLSSHGCSGPAAPGKCNYDYGNYNPVLVGPNGVK